MKKYISLFVLFSVLALGIPKANATILPLSNKSPVISGISGPQSLKVGEIGNWEIKAYNPDGGNLSYSVFWGDEMEMTSATSNVKEFMLDYKQISNFSHSYYKAGNYTPVFTVTNSNGKSITTSLSVKVSGDTQEPKIKVTSPNGGETWKTGTTQTITWKYQGQKFTCQELGLKCLDVVPSYDISLLRKNVCNSGMCLALAYAPIEIAKDVTGNSYDWKVGNSLNGIEVASDVDYKIMVCYTDAKVCDQSDGYFRIVSQNANAPIISGVSGPELLKVGQMGTWKVNAQDPNGGSLSYSVNWGDPTYKNCLRSDTPCARILAEDSNQYSQSATFTHSYSENGNYKIVFTVTNDKGKSAETTLKVVVKDLKEKKGNYFGYLKPQGPSTIMWGTHVLSGYSMNYCILADCASSALSYPVKAVNDTVLKDLIKYENRRVKIKGEFVWYDLEGGFWGITATKVTPLPNIWDLLLKRGMKSDAVLEIQDYLNRQGFNLKADGSFGPKTEKAVKEFQTQKGISVTGKVDGTTMNSLIGEQ